MPLGLSTETFIKKARKIHAVEYDYSKVKYINRNTAVEIVCPKHGLFLQKAGIHLRGFGCSKCSKKYKRTTSEFIEEARKIHKDKYNYSCANYTNLNTPVSILCPIHGEFKQRPKSHLRGHRCPKCSVKNNVLAKHRIFTDSFFIDRASKVHKNKYDYSQVKYVNNNHKVKIICPKHGLFKMTPANHLSLGQGCPKCGVEKRARAKIKTPEQFFKEVNSLHQKKYKYCKSSYNKGGQSILDVSCSLHGDFKIKAFYHLAGGGCPKCHPGGFNPNKPATLYYLYDPHEDLYKIGVTNKSIEERFGKAFCSERAIAILEQTHYEKGEEAYLVEQEILQAFSEHRCVNASWPEDKGGKTEFFKIDVLKKGLTE